MNCIEYCMYVTKLQNSVGAIKYVDFVERR